MKLTVSEGSSTDRRISPYYSKTWPRKLLGQTRRNAYRITVVVKEISGYWVGELSLSWILPAGFEDMSRLEFAPFLLTAVTVLGVCEIKTVHYRFTVPLEASMIIMLVIPPSSNSEVFWRGFTHEFSKEIIPTHYRFTIDATARVVNLGAGLRAS